MIGRQLRSNAVSLSRHVHARFTTVAWNGVAYVLPKVAVLAAGLFVAHRFGHEAFARYSLAAVTLMVVGNLVGASLGTVASKYVQEFAGGNSALIGRGFASLMLTAAAFAIALSLALFVVAPTLATAFAVEPDITGLLEIASGAVAACILSGAASGLLTGSTRFKQVALANSLAVAMFAASLLPLNAIAGPGGALAALALFYTISAATALFFVRRQVRTDFRASTRRELRARIATMLRYFLPMLLAAGMITPVVWLCNTLLTRSADALIEVARFNAGYNWFAVVSAIPAVLAQVEFVHMARAQATGDTQRLAHVLKLFIAQNLLFVAPVVIAGASLAGLMMGLFSVDDAQARSTLRLLLAAALFASLGNPAGMYLAATDRIWIASLLNIAWALVVLACAAWLRDLGAIGIGIAFVIGYAIHFFAASAVVWRMIRANPSN